MPLPKCAVCDKSVWHGLAHYIPSLNVYGTSVCSNCICESRWYMICTVRTLLMHDYNKFKIDRWHLKTSKCVAFVFGDQLDFRQIRSMTLCNAYVEAVLKFYKCKEDTLKILKKIDLPFDLIVKIESYLYN